MRQAGKRTPDRVNSREFGVQRKRKGHLKAAGERRIDDEAEGGTSPSIGRIVGQES